MTDADAVADLLRDPLVRGHPAVSVELALHRRGHQTLTQALCAVVKLLCHQADLYHKALGEAAGLREERGKYDRGTE